MADYAEIDAYGAESGQMPGALMVLFGWAGAMMSIALIVGLGVWGYQLAMRDVTGVPVVRALEGPMRVQPEDPGGSQAAFQGLSVNSVAAVGTAEAPADRLVLAPAPVDLTPEDQPRTDLIETATLEAPNAPAFDVETTAEFVTDSADGQPLDLIGDVNTRTTPLIRDVPLVPTSVAGVKRSPIPRLRPTAIDLTAEAVATEVALAVSRPGAREIAPASVPAGTRLVQFGAYDSPEAARSAWDAIEGSFKEFMQGKQRVVQEAVSGGKTFYRLRAMGFADLNDARRFCSALVADRQACIPVVVR